MFLKELFTLTVYDVPLGNGPPLPPVSGAGAGAGGVKGKRGYHALQVLKPEGLL